LHSRRWYRRWHRRRSFRPGVCRCSLALFGLARRPQPLHLFLRLGKHGCALLRDRGLRLRLLFHLLHAWRWRRKLVLLLLFLRC
jgi:hypothetical protein